MTARWTPQELTDLRASYPTEPLATIAARLQRTPAAIQIMATRKMGLRRARREHEYRAARFWTPAMLATLRENYPTVSTRVLAAQLDRPVAAVRQRAVKLGLRKIGRPGYVYSEDRRRYRVRPDAFARLTPDTAYVLGFIVADGNIGPGRFKISNTELDILHAMRVALHSDHPIGRQTGRLRPCYELTIVNKALTAQLVALGLTRAKSLTACLPVVDDALFPHLLRGYFDGDGAVRWSPRGGLMVKFTSGSALLLQQVAAAITRHLGLTQRAVTHDKDRPHACRLNYSGRDALAIADAMYADAGTLFLQRKRQVFEQYRIRENYTPRRGTLTNST